jgi:hypothetical protein
MSDIQQEIAVYHKALKDAIQMMNDFIDLEPTSALKQAGSDNGIKYGSQMETFVTWANSRLF